MLPFEVETGSPVDGTLLSEIAWPRDSLVTSVHRVRQLIIPRGNTLLQSGDRLSIVAQVQDEKPLRALLSAAGSPTTRNN